MSKYSSKHAITDADFKLFLVLWNQRQNLKTPKLHLDMAHWLEHAHKAGSTQLLLMAFRSAGKSTLVGLFCAWLLYRDPNIRILVLAADFTLAKKMVRNVKRIIERHPLTNAMKPKSADQWASDRFTVKRTLELRDPSMMAKGVTSNITGSRADIVICDDVEVPNTCDSAEKRTDLRERLTEIAYVMVAGGTQIYVGTPHSYYSIYADTPRTEIGEEGVFLDGFNRLVMPIRNDKGESQWPERYSESTIDHIKKQTGPNKFNSQMMLKPVNIMEGRLNPDLLVIYSGDVVYDKHVQKLFIGSRKMVAASCWWDPAFGSAKGDNSVCAILFADQGGNYFLHHLEYIQIDETDERNEAVQQSRIVADLAKKYHLPSITVEKNGIGGFLPNILRNELVKAKSPTRVQDAYSTQNKAVRIIEGFDAIMAAERLYVHENITETPFIMEMREWQPSAKNTRDDGLDAVAGALSLHPDRLERLQNIGAHNWMRGKAQHTATTDFKV